MILQLKNPTQQFPYKIDLSGRFFERLQVIGFHDKAKASKRWLCLCKCGSFKIVRSGHLKNGHTTSCGCLASEVITARNETHGASGTSEHGIWKNIMTRCRNQNNDNYPDYGGRGIKICKRWLKFENFLEDMGPRPSLSHSIDRINNDGDYEPSNCRWATSTEQANNRRGNHLIEVDGKRMTIAQWCSILGVKEQRVRDRIRLGWSAEEALKAPKMS